MKYKVHSVLILLLLCLTARSQEVAQFPFQFHKGLIFLELQTATGDTLLGLFDTGAEVSAINTATAERLGLQVTDTTSVTGTDSSMTVEVVGFPHLHLGNHYVEMIHPTKRDLGHSLSLPGRRLDLIIGNEVFANTIVEINWVKKEILIHRNLNLQSYDFWVPFFLDHNIPRFTGKLNDAIQTDFRLDTGASLFETNRIYLNITTRNLEKLKKILPALEPASYLSATGINNKPFKLPVYELKKLQVGPLEIQNPFAIVQPETGYFALPDAVGFLSNNFLSKYERVAIDFIRNRLYFSGETEVLKK